MFDFLKPGQESDFFAAQKLREKNNMAIQKLFEVNKELQESSEITNVYLNRKQRHRAEMELNKEYEQRMKELQRELDTWRALKEKAIKEDNEVVNLFRRKNELEQQLRSMNQELMDPVVLKCKIKGAKEQKKMVKKLNAKLKKQVKSLTEKVSYQTKLHDSYREADGAIKGLARINEHLMQKIQHLKEKLEPGTSTKFGLQHVKKKDRDRLVSRLSSYVHKINTFTKKFDSFIPDIEKFQRVIQFHMAVNPENDIPPPGDERLAGKMDNGNVSEGEGQETSNQSPEDSSESQYEMSDEESEEPGLSSVSDGHPEPEEEDGSYEETDYEDDEDDQDDQDDEDDEEESLEAIYERPDSGSLSSVSDGHPEPEEEDCRSEETDYEDDEEESHGTPEEQKPLSSSTKSEKHPELQDGTFPVSPSAHPGQDAEPNQGRRSEETTAQINSGVGDDGQRVSALCRSNALSSGMKISGKKASPRLKV